MRSSSLVIVQSILILLKTTLAVPVEAPPFWTLADPTTSLTVPLTNHVSILPANTSLTIWPKHPFTIALTPLSFTWIQFQTIGFPGTPQQKSLLL